MDKKEPSPLVEAGIEQQACPGLSRFHEAGETHHIDQVTVIIAPSHQINEN
ncbi:hypothetical protein [Cyanothece sp. BG0011]|uniref:hypothetical protein n=1 Tax=Cyanothece sp. BG0011 TaxID=2082950 RepID=UPI0013006CA8